MLGDEFVRAAGLACAGERFKKNIIEKKNFILHVFRSTLKPPGVTCIEEEKGLLLFTPN